MNTPDFSIWMETYTGRKTLIASSSYQTSAPVVGEAVRARFRQLQSTALDIHVIEVHNSSTSPEPDASHLFVRWSSSGREQFHGSSASRSVSAAKRRSVPSPTIFLRDSRFSVSEQQETDPAKSLGLAAFFPTAEELVPWKTWKRQEL